MLFYQMLEVAPKPGREPLGDARFDPALRLDQRVGADPGRSGRTHGLPLRILGTTPAMRPASPRSANGSPSSY